MENKLFRAHTGYRDCSDGHSWGPGMRNVYIFHLVVSGRGYFEADGKKVGVTKGQIFLIRPGRAVRYYPDTSDPFCYRWIDFGGTLAEELIDGTVFRESDVSDALDLDQTERFFVSGKALPSGIDASLLSLFAYLIEKLPSPVSDNEKQAVHRLSEYIANTFHRPSLSVDGMSAAFGFSRAQIYRLFMSEYGISPKQFIINTRINEAKRLLLTTDMPIKSIALSVGYENALYFSNAFRKCELCSPKEYRSSVR